MRPSCRGRSRALSSRELPQAAGSWQGCSELHSVKKEKKEGKKSCEKRAQQSAQLLNGSAAALHSLAVDSL